MCLLGQDTLGRTSVWQTIYEYEYAHYCLTYTSYQILLLDLKLFVWNFIIFAWDIDSFFLDENKKLCNLNLLERTIFFIFEKTILKNLNLFFLILFCFAYQKRTSFIYKTFQQIKKSNFQNLKIQL